MESKPHQFKLALPEDVKVWLAVSAANAMRSQGAHVVFCLRKQMEAETAAQK